VKNQYFGDINDYRKYGLLRAIVRASGLSLYVAWMLTPDDGGSDGKFVSYLDDPERWKSYDLELYCALRGFMRDKEPRRVSMIESTDLLPKTKCFSEVVPDAGLERDEWFRQLLVSARDFDFIFLDPDNGLEIKSKPYGRKKSSKYLYWREIEELWSSGMSLLIYQHFIHENRCGFIQRLLAKLQSKTPGSLVEAFSTPNVVFLMALQPEHHCFHQAIVNDVRKRWQEQVRHWELVRHTGQDGPTLG